jgi:dienelactone hydrolase
MYARGTAVRLVVGLAVTFLLGGCAAGASVSPSATPAATASPSMAVATPTPRPRPTVVSTTNLAYESTNPGLVPGTLDVYAPTRAGPWPVVVMFHGAPGSDPVTDRSYLGVHARRVAELGFVVFNASWGHVPGGGGSEPPDADDLLAVESQAACAVAFARAKASGFGGDPTTMIVFGHSGGAHAAAMVAFNRPEPTVGCLGGATLGTIDTLVTWEGNWLLSVNYPDWNAALAADPGVMDIVTPWRSLPGQADLRVVMLVSEHPGTFFEREVGNPWAADSWLAVRDPSGDLRRQLEANGAIADGILDFVDVQRLLYSVLEAQGNPVSLDVMPDSVHDRLGTAGWPVFLGAFQKAAAKD